MITKNNIKHVSIILICFSIIFNSSTTDLASLNGRKPDYLDNTMGNVVFQDTSSTAILNRLNSDFQASIISGDTLEAKLLNNSILRNLNKRNIDSLVLSNSHYYLGVFNLILGNNNEAIVNFKKTLFIRETLEIEDEILAKSFYNLGVAYNKLSDYKKMGDYGLKSLEIDKKIFGKTNPVLILDFSNLVIANFELNKYYEAISYGNEAIKLIEAAPNNFSIDIAIFYTNIGICYTRLSDYTKAILYLEKAESIYNHGSLSKDATYINLLNNLASNYLFMGLNEKSDEYFKKGFEIALSSNSILSLNFINSFAIILAKAGKLKEGEDLILSSLEKARVSSGPDSRDYFEILKNYAEYIRIYKNDYKTSLLIYERCILYLNDHEEDISLYNPVILGYAKALTKSGNSAMALGRIQELLFAGKKIRSENSDTENPEIDLIEPNQWSINLLEAKYSVLWDIFKISGDFKYLFAAAGTSELIVSLLEKARINISEEESRLVLGDRYRDSYLFPIRDFELCYRNTGVQAYLDKAFEYSEKSKVAGLLAAARELRATQFHLPDDLAELERKIKSKISFNNARVSEENNKRSPDLFTLSKLKEEILIATQQRDSLIKIFEKEYPEYYLLKYNTSVVNPGEIPGIAGRKTNYINYVVTDTVLYIFLTNRRFRKLITQPVDSAFFVNVMEFRRLLSNPSPGTDARNEFISYQNSGQLLYKTLFEPVREYLISDRLLIAPDNILSYIPFEALLKTERIKDDINYNGLSYLMNDYRVSYTYSATILSETVMKGPSLTNRLLSFAPVYHHVLNLDSLLMTKQVIPSPLADLPFARQEAEYISKLTSGENYTGDSATEAVFKSKAGDYDIIHLAMHTVLNDKYPMHSKMLFYQDNNLTEDGSLNTYEVYDLSLKAKMVILSSCNTGTGPLNSGEGILSLARGFIFSGSQSVIMSMWEIEDKSGTEIIKKFYRYLKNGYTKSNALKKARLDYRKKADMLRSHPYFWSALVIYGNNGPLYYPGRIFIISGSFLLIFSILLVVYYRFR